MSKLTSEQANELANNFLGLAQAIGDFRYQNWNSLLKNENQKLGNLQSSILNYGEDILAFSTMLVMDEVETSLKRIDQITLQIKSTIHTLKNIQKVINIAAAIVTFGAAILNKDPQSITKALDGIFKASEEDQ